VGDAIGAVLEFAKYTITEEHVDRAMTLPGGGPLGVAPGQVTDDSELMLALLTALAHDTDPDDHGSFPSRAVARRYIEWHRSQPFDIGMTCARAFAFVENEREMAENAARYSMVNESNGAAMRCAPIAVWGTCKNMNVDEIVQHAKSDAELSHPSRACIDANALICAVLARIFDAETSHISSLAEVCLSQIDSMCATEQEDDSKIVMGQKVRSWVKEAEELSDNDVDSYSQQKQRNRLPACDVNVGHVKHAVVLLVIILRRFASGYYTCYTHAIRDVLLSGGDTDTNACICGYVAGALCGYSAIPENMRKRVLTFDCSSVIHDKKNLLGNERPVTYRSANVFSLLRRLVTVSTDE